MKGIILAGGTGSRLWPTTKVVSKQLLPIYDKPLIYYPIATLMQLGIRDILIITTEQDSLLFQNLLGNGNDFGVNISFETQKKPEGLAQSFWIAEEFVGNDNVILILGDNIFHGLEINFSLISEFKEGALIFGYQVADPERYGVIEFDHIGNILSIEEKPKSPKSNYVVPGLYIFDNSVVLKSKMISKSLRGEYEIASVLQQYLEQDKLKAKLLSRGFAWMDCGTIQSMGEASAYVKALEERQGAKIACIEEIAFNHGWINKDTLSKKADEYKNNEYGKYLTNLITIK